MTSAKIQFKCNELILWRDGHKAVVTLTINGRSVRILEADCREMFYETANADMLREASRQDDLARRRRRKKGDVAMLEAAE
jgi:hypothetical protein